MSSSSSGIIDFLLSPFAQKAARDAPAARKKPANTPEIKRITEKPTPVMAERGAFLIPNEIKYFQLLREILSDEYYLLTKVPLDDLFGLTQSRKNHSSVQKLGALRADFVICDVHSMQPLAALLLDDSSASGVSNSIHSPSIGDFFIAAQLPVFHLSSSQPLNHQSLQEILHGTIHFPFPPYKEPSPASA